MRLQARRPDGSVVTLRPLARGDRGRWQELRARNREWLQPWEATIPYGVEPRLTFGQLRRGLDRSAREGRALPFVIDDGTGVVGQMHLFDVVWGPRCTGTAGYWLDREAVGRGLATWSLAMLIDHALTDYGLHRVEVNIRPENTDSLAVARRLGLRDEGERVGLVHVAGDWRDHRSFAVTADELAGGTLVGALSRRSPDHPRS
ncbi:GNAT family protein [Ornithinicoccus hortensis]|uniref:Ribosomal-protein-alanine N-acetyltransferase n=1 Tax=Ornithinicoccus hortensis TaxID=82346 RepID=A0A542YVN5_9MICO|nr:ribosomal-protein-alanine N-acetyltransferase [Ornithinicoccus hortensis]